MNGKDAIELAKSWTIGNKYRKASLIRQYDLKPVEKGGKIRMDIFFKTEKDTNAIVPGLDKDNNLVFVMGHPPIAYSYKDLFTTPKAPKKPTVVAAKPIKKTTATTTARSTVKGNAKGKAESINYRKEVLLRIDSVRGMSSQIIEWFLNNSSFTINERPSKIEEEFNQFMSTINEKLQYKIHAIDEKGNEFETDWQEDEQDLEPLKSELENQKKWNAVDIIKKLNNGEDEEDESTKPKSSIKLRKIKANESINPFKGIPLKEGNKIEDIQKMIVNNITQSGSAVVTNVINKAISGINAKQIAIELLKVKPDDLKATIDILSNILTPNDIALINNAMYGKYDPRTFQPHNPNIDAVRNLFSDMNISFSARDWSALNHALPLKYRTLILNTKGFKDGIKSNSPKNPYRQNTIGYWLWNYGYNRKLQKLG